MTTATRTPVSGVKAIAILAACAAAAIYFTSVQGRPIREETQDHVTFTATWNPPHKSMAVHIIVMVEGVELENTLVADSPWADSYWVPKGAQTSVHIAQVEAGRVDCTASVNGTQVDTNSRNEIGSLRCWVNRRAKA